VSDLGDFGEDSRLDGPAESQVHVGNAAEDGADHRGWFIGHFIPAPVRSSRDVEVKWGLHPAGEERPTWSPGDLTSTMVLLVKGRFKVLWEGGEVEFSRPGDYAVWGPGTAHRWAAIEDSVVLTVRWPSR
jgi:hypothetical protein